MRYLLAIVVGILIATVPLHAQANTKILTGEKAIRLFVYAGKPVHPFCLGFPIEASSRSVPVDLAKCSATNVVAASSGKGRWSAEYPRDNGAFFISAAPYVSYGVLANKGDRFLIASDSSGGGSGQFSNLFWVRLDGKQLVLVEDEMGGDRCAGGLSDFRTQGSVVFFSVNIASAEILALSGLKLDRAITNKLHSGYVHCDGRAIYRYDLKTEKRELTTVEVNRPEETSDAAAAEPQPCFEKVVLLYTRGKTATLKTDKLRELGRRFAATCLAAQP
jgi:hypothetical protein